jgi:hypothetical protein
MRLGPLTAACVWGVTLPLSLWCSSFLSFVSIVGSVTCNTYRPIVCLINESVSHILYDNCLCMGSVHACNTGQRVGEELDKVDQVCLFLKCWTFVRSRIRRESLPAATFKDFIFSTETDLDTGLAKPQETSNDTTTRPRTKDAPSKETTRGRGFNCYRHWCRNCYGDRHWNRRLNRHCDALVQEPSQVRGQEPARGQVLVQEPARGQEPVRGQAQALVRGLEPAQVRG